jgi:3-hydroxyisobutyrate dehydrogenase-like beta-hydroxyacid dehydrogenase
MKLSFIGLGSMGSAMATRLIESGHDVTVWNRSAGATEALVSAGASAVDSVQEAFQNPFVFSMLSNDAAALEQFSAENLAAAAPGTIHVNHSSLSPEAADELTARHATAGVGYLACPVLGRPVAAGSGQLNILAGGDPVLVEKVQPVLDILGKRTWNMGDSPRRANLVKIGVNFNIIHAVEALGESIALMERGGVDPEAFVELLTNTLFGGIVYSGYGNAIATKSYFPAGFSVALGRKDLGLAADMAAEFGLSLPTVPALIEVFDKTLANPEFKDADWASIAQVSRDQ